MQNQYATGKTTYFGGLPNATSGTLSPDGYIKREQNKSQRRSGLAAVALARQRKLKKPAQTTENQPTKHALNVAGIYVSPTGRLGRLQ